MLKWLKQKAGEWQSGDSDFQTKKRAARAKARNAEYQATAQWMAEHGAPQTFNATTWNELLQKAQFRPGLQGAFLANRNDIERKLAHGGGQASYLVGFSRADNTIFVVWWVWRDRGGDYAGLKPYYSLTNGEKPSDYWANLPDAI